MGLKKRCAVITALLLLFSGKPVSAAGTEYTIAPGDTLWKISQSYSVSIASIKSYNNLQSDSIYAGQKILIPQSVSNTYIVVSGDTLWTISQKFNTSVSEIKTLNKLSSDVIYTGQVLSVSDRQAPAALSYKVVSGDTLWGIANKFGTTISDIKFLNNLQTDLIYVGQSLSIPGPAASAPSTPADTSAQQVTHIEYTNYTVKQGDNPWTVGQQFGIPYQEVLTANSLTESSSLYIGQVLRIPVHVVPVKATPGPQYGELLDWWTEAQYVFYTGTAAKVTDFYTGKSFYIKRTTGANHADCETLTPEDTSIMKGLYGGTWQWINRPVIIEVNGHKIAASMAGMPHAGLDAYPALANVDNRSGSYGYGLNFDYIKGNNMDGHFDVHFLNSTRHVDGTVDPDHQAKIHIAAGQ
jgi:FOG: LysM repeat